MKDALEAPQPKPSILKSLWNTLKGINEGASYIENVTKLGVLIAPILPGITEYRPRKAASHPIVQHHTNMRQRQGANH